jgi:4-hydroxybenzoate polyprenyltransferase
LLLLYLVTELVWLALVGVAAVGALMVYQHTLVKSNDKPDEGGVFYDRRVRQRDFIFDVRQRGFSR